MADLLAFIDESGQRASTAASSDHFVMSAVVFVDSAQGAVTKLLADLRFSLGRAPGQELHWKKLRSHSQRLHAAQSIGGAASPSGATAGSVGDAPPGGRRNLHLSPPTSRLPK